MATLAQALPWVLPHEGGWSDDPVDPGGATNKGITLAKARKHGITTKEELRQITDEKVAEIYQADYFRYFEGISDQRVATKIFDLAINMQEFGNRGPVIRMVQEALNTLGFALGVNGVWGPKTEVAVNAAPADRLIEVLCEAATNRYRAIVAKRPTSAKFLNGWLKRAGMVPP